jgi:hypothetical protein
MSSSPEDVWVNFGFSGARKRVKAKADDRVAAIFEQARIADQSFREATDQCSLSNIWPVSGGPRWCDKNPKKSELKFLCDNDREIQPADIATEVETYVTDGYGPQDTDSRFNLFSWFLGVLEAWDARGRAQDDIRPDHLHLAWTRVCQALLEHNLLEEWIREDDKFREIAKRLLFLYTNLDRQHKLPTWLTYYPTIYGEPAFVWNLLYGLVRSFLGATVAQEEQAKGKQLRREQAIKDFFTDDNYGAFKSKCNEMYEVPEESPLKNKEGVRLSL